MIVAFRRHTLLSLDDCLCALQPSLPHLARSAPHRCLQRNGISRLREVEGDKPKWQRFKRYPIRFFHIDMPRFRRRRAGSTSAWILTVPASSRSSNSWTRQIAEPRGSSSKICSRPPISHPRDPHSSTHGNATGSKDHCEGYPVRRSAPQPEHRIFKADAVRHDLRSK